MVESELGTSAQRLRAELERVFGSVAKAVPALGLKHQGELGRYLNGTSEIGKKMRARLEAVGIDVGYILTGRHSASPTPEQPKQEPAFPPDVEKQIEELAENAYQSAKLWGPKKLSPKVEKELRRIARKIAEEKIVGKKLGGY